jgi:hypothetical protein
MAIIDTFLMLFKADTSSVKKGTDESEKGLVKLGDQAKKTDKQVQHIGESLVKSATAFTGLVAGFASLAAVTVGFKSSLDYTRNIADISRELQINESVVDSWGRVLKRTGGDANSFKNAIQGLQGRYGGTPEQILAQLPKFADSFSKLSKSQALIRGKQFGLDVPTILLLQQGRRELESLIQQQIKLGVVTDKDAIALRAFDNALDNASQAYSTFFRDISRPLLPGFTKAINYLVEHQDIVEGALLGIAGAALLLASPFIIANAAVIALTGGIALLITGFALVFEDIKSFIQGTKDSLTGAVVNNYGKRIKQTIGVAKDRLESFKHPGGFIDQVKNNFSNAYNNNPFFGGNSVHVGKVEINTQSTDAKGIFQEFSDWAKEKNQAQDHFSSAVLY